MDFSFSVTVHAENKAFLCHCEAFRPKQSQKRTILDCFASLAMTKMRFPRERLPFSLLLMNLAMPSGRQNKRTNEREITKHKCYSVKWLCYVARVPQHFLYFVFIFSALNNQVHLNEFSKVAVLSANKDAFNLFIGD